MSRTARVLVIAVAVSAITFLTAVDRASAFSNCHACVEYCDEQSGIDICDDPVNGCNGMVPDICFRDDYNFCDWPNDRIWRCIEDA